MLSLFTRFYFIVAILFLFAGHASANDSDLVNCNHAWKIVVLGSSSSYGYGASTYDSAWVGKFTAYVKRKNPANEVYNLGIPGFTTYQNLCPTGFVPPTDRPSPNTSFNITAALGYHPDAIIINMPTNDAANNFTVAETEANYERAMHIADSAHIPVWVTTTQPRNNMTVAQVSSLIAVRDWTYSRFGDKAIDFWTTVANPDGSIAAFYDYDYAHVNDFGHDIFYKRTRAETILDSLCARITQILIAKAGNDVAITLPVSSVVLNGSASFSSLGGQITSYSWSKISGPASGQIVSPSAAVTTVNTLSEGRYSFSLTVTDNAFNVKSDTVNVVISSRILIDFGPDLTTSPDAGGKYWNVITETQPGIKLSNALTTGNVSTAIGLQVINRIDGTFNVSGPGTNTGNTLGALNDYPATATSDFSFAEPSGSNGQWKITGLEATKQYTIKFWGTKSVSDDRIIQIKRADQVVWQEYNAAGNSIYENAAIFTFFGKTQMSFDIRVKSGSAFGYICLVDISRTTPSQALNIPPVARASDVNVSLPGTSGILDGTSSSDDDGNIVSYQWMQTSGPSTAQVVSPNAAITAMNNLVEGTYTFQLKVTDDSAAVATTNVTVLVNLRVLFDIGPDLTPAPDAGGKYWNNVVNGLAGIKTSNAISTGNAATSINFEIVNRIDGTFNIAGPGTNTGNTVGDVGDYFATATNDFAFAHASATNGQWKWTGLDNTKQYTFKFWGTRTAADERTIKIKRSDESTWKQYDARNNNDYNNAAVFSFTGKTQVTFDIMVDANSSFGHISVVDIKITTPPVVCTAAVSVTSSQPVASCSGSSITFTATPVNGGTNPAYQWKRNGVNIAGATASTYTTTTLLNNDIISCFMTANTVCATGTTATSNNITVAILPIVPKAGNISGPTEICSLVGTANNAVYSIAPLANATIYVWTVPAGATIVSGQGTTSIAVSFNVNFGNADTISVVGGFCTNSAPAKLLITKLLPATPGSITGPVNVCSFIDLPANAGYSIAAVPNAVSYTWTVPVGATIISGQGTTSVQVSFTSVFTSGSIKVTSNANCGSRAARSLSISKLLPSTPASITGPSSACAFKGNGAQATYTIAPANNATSYLWTLPANVSLVSGQGTTSIIVTFSNAYTTSVIKVKSVSNCGSSSDRSLSISTTTQATPGSITGPSNACQYIGSAEQATYTIIKVAGASSYTWSVPAGVVIASHPGGSGVNDTIIKVNYNNSFVNATSLSVQSVGCGSSAARALSIARSGTISTPSVISGPVNACSYAGTAATASYRISRVSLASSYTWSLPAGATAAHPNGAGINDTIISVTYSSSFAGGNIVVTAVNACASSTARSLAVKLLVPATAPIISGPSDPCPWIGTPGATYKINKIDNASSYSWTIPATGATVVHPNGAGINDTIIIVTYTNAFTTGSITARADATCGSSLVRTFTLTRKLSATPGLITATLVNACPNRQYTYSIAALPSNANSITWAVPAGAVIISGQGTTSISVTYPQTAVSGSVTAFGTNACGNSTGARTLNVSLVSCQAARENIRNTNPFTKTNVLEVLQGMEVSAMPNPSESRFKLLVKSSDKATPVYLRVTDISSKMIETKAGIMPGQTVIIGGNYTSGLYIAEFIQRNNHKIIKLIKL